MHTIVSGALRPSLVLIAALAAACSEQGTVAPGEPAAIPPQLATMPTVDTDGAIATMQRVTARYQDLDVAIADGFVLLHECENRPGEGPVGTVYVHIGRLIDGLIDPSNPDALIYEPSRLGRPKLVGVEFAVPYTLWTDPAPPQFLGATFQREDEFGVFALHAWVWLQNPEGLFAETNPRVSCGEA